MRKRRTLMKRLLAIALVVVMVFTSQNLSGIVSAIADEGETLVESEVMTYVSDVELPSNDELFAGYVDKEFYGEAVTFGVSARNRLESDAAKNVYDILKAKIEMIASGELESTVFTIGYQDEANIFSYPDMTADEAKEKFLSEIGMIMDALLVDCPYDLYWFDKLNGMGYNYYSLGNGSYAPGDISFCVAGNYQSGNFVAKSTTVDISLTSATSTAVDNAKAIVKDNESLDDYSKLKAYKEKICELVEYDHNAANSGNFSADNDPWQLIHVFDGDANTNVVCEGYSKAFQYLCDMSTFESGYVRSYIATGTMDGGTGAGGHMWNIVTMEDSYNYIVDITNSDAGSIGQNGGLFLAGTATGDVTEGYTFTIGSSNIKFVYDEDDLSLWGTDTDSILILADSDYEYTPVLDYLRISDMYVVVGGEYDSTVVLPDGVAYDHSTRTITLNNANLELVLESGDCLIEAVGDYTIVINGDNTITPVLDDAFLEKDVVQVIKVDGNLTISGTGSLGIDVSGINVKSEVYGIHVLDNMVINGGNISVTTGNLSDNGCFNEAIWVEGNLTINAGCINAVAGNAIYSEDGWTYGIEVEKNMTVAEGVTVYATAGAGSISSNGIAVGGILTSSGDITASAGGAATCSEGIWAATLDVNGGRIVATAGESYGSYGIEGNDITINDAYIEAYSGSEDICWYGSMYIDSSVVVSKGQKKVAVYGEAALQCDLETDSNYTFKYVDDATLTLGEYSVVLTDGGTLSDEALAGIVDEVAMVTLSDGTNIYYGDFDEAIDTASANSDSTLTLLADVNRQIIIYDGKFTIDLNGYDVIVEIDYDYAITVTYGDEIVIKDSSEAKTSVISNVGGAEQSGDTIYNNGILYLEDVKCTGSSTGIRNDGNGTLYVKDCVVEGKDALANFSDMYIDGSTITGSIVNMDGNMYISGDIVCSLDSYYKGNVYIAGALTEGASIIYDDNDRNFDEVAKSTGDYSITESDMGKFTHRYALEGYAFGINSSGNIQVYGDLAKAVLSITPESFIYNGAENIIEEVIKFNNVELNEGIDYTVEYTDNTNVGEATVTVKGMGNYIGTLTESFYINAATITVSNVNVDVKTYDGNTVATVAGVTFAGLAGSDELVLGTDYTITASFADANAGTDKSVTYTITLLDTAVAKNYTFTGGARTCTGTATGTIGKASAPTLNIDVQEATYGDENLNFNIAQLITGIPSDAGDVSYDLGIMVPYGWSVAEDGILTISKLTVTAGLTGTVDIVVSTDNYEDATVRFTVESKASDVSDVADVILSGTEFEYSGSEEKPVITVVVGNVTLTEGTDYEITYPDDVITAGNKEITITFKGNYTGEILDTYKIELKALDVEVVIKDKQYDGKTGAEIESVILAGVVTGDDVTVSFDGVTAAFSDALLGNNKAVTLVGQLTLTGADAANYSIEQPGVVSGKIVNNYTAVQNVDYTVNSNEWINKAFVITAKDGYELSSDNNADGTWAQTIEVKLEGADTVSFYVRNKATGAISLIASEDYYIDYTAPTGSIYVHDEVNWNTLGNAGAFKLFFNVNRTVEIFGDDSKSEYNSDVAKIEYYVSADVITDKAELLLVNWNQYTGAITLTQNSKQYVYAKITDIAGNYTFIDSEGIVVYTDAEAVTTEADYTKASSGTVTVSVKPNGNTIKGLYLVNGATEVVVEDAYYSISGSNIILSNQYLDEVLKAGTYTFRVEYNPYGVVYDGANSNSVEPKKTEFTLNINKATGGVEITNSSDMNITFGDSVVKPQYNTNNTGDVVVEYKVKGAADSAYTEEKPVNAGDYTVRVTVKENDTYTGCSDTADFMIIKASAPQVNDVVKNILCTIASTGNIIDISALLPVNRGATGYVATSDSEILKNVSIDANGKLTFDTLTATAETTETIEIEVVMENYETTTVVVKVAFVDKEVVTITGVQAATGLIYDGTVKQGYTGTPTSEYTGEYVITYTKNGATINALADVEPIDAGDYTVTIAVPNDNPYYMGSVTLEFTIGKATPVADDVTITSPVTLVYDGNAKEVVIETTDDEIGAVTVYYYVDGQWTTTGPVNAGTYDVAVDIAESDNYKSASKIVVGEIEIAPRDIAGVVITLDDTNLTYNGKTQTKNVVSVVLDVITLDTDDYVITENTGIDADDYELVVTGKGNFKGSVTADWSIAKKSLSITADTATKVYGDADPEFTYKAIGLVDGDSIVVTLKREEGENVGDYNIALDSFKGDNYDMTFTAGKLTITAKDIADAVVTLGDELTYNGKAQTQSIASVVVDGKTLSASDYEVAGNVGANAGDYELTVTGKGNYTGTATVAWTMAKKDIATAVITLDDEVVTYDETEHTKNVVSVVVDGITLDIAEYKVTGNVGTNAGDYELTVTIIDSENYTGEAKAEWSIAPMEITDIEVTVDEEETFVYNGTEQTKEVLEVAINGEALNESEYEVIGNVQKDSGEHVIVVSLTGNYSGTVEITWTIKKAASVADVETNVLPEASNEVSNDVEKLSDVKLPEGWVWSDEDADITLEPGKEITVTAVYVGEDKANYENTTMIVKITRAEKVVADEPAVDNPYTGDTRNTILWLYVLVLSGLAAMVATKKRRSVE